MAIFFAPKSVQSQKGRLGKVRNLNELSCKSIIYTSWQNRNKALLDQSVLVPDKVWEQVDHGVASNNKHRTLANKFNQGLDPSLQREFLPAIVIPRLWPS